MKTIALTLILITIPLIVQSSTDNFDCYEKAKKNCEGFGYGECSTLQIAKECIDQKKRLKRQEYIEKCDEYLQRAEYSTISLDGKEDLTERMLANAQIAAAYCLRASLEDVK